MSDTISGKVKGFEMYGEVTAPKNPPVGVLYFFLYDCKLSGSLTVASGKLLEYTSDGWKEWEGDIYAPLDDLLERELG